VSSASSAFVLQTSSHKSPFLPFLLVHLVHLAASALHSAQLVIQALHTLRAVKSIPVPVLQSQTSPFLVVLELQVAHLVLSASQLLQFGCVQATHISPSFLYEVEHVVHLVRDSQSAQAPAFIPTVVEDEHVLQVVSI
jgi:hypothetical protein